MKYAIKVNELDKENRIHTLIDDVEANLADAEHMKFNVILTPQITTTNSHFKNTFTHPQPQEWTNYLQVLGATCHLKTNVDGKPNTFEYDNDGAFKRNKEKYLKCKERLIVQHRLWNLFVSDSTCEQLDNEQIAEVNPSSVLDHIANEAKILATYRCYEQFLATKVGDGNEGITDKELQQAKQAYDRQGVEQLRSICDNGISLIPIDNNISDEKQRKRIQELNQQFMELLSKYIKRADEMSALSLQHPSQDLSMKHT